ncbi:MAG: hypothetical protein AAGG01_17650, partial [Planctomycetota bacterium]
RLEDAAGGAGRGYYLQDLIQDDDLVAYAWRHWTLYHQVITSASWDSTAHNNHMTAILDAVSTETEWWTAGVPYVDANVLVSDKTKKKKGNGGGNVTPPIPEDEIPRAARAMHNCITMRRGVLDSFVDLYEADGGWWLGHVGFDCDDYADALAHYLIKDKEGYTSSTVRVTWTEPGGKGTAHRITKVTCGDYYWLADAQSGQSSGPYTNDTPADGSSVIGGGAYCIDPDKPIRTTDDNRAVGVRTGWGEPYVWSSDADQRRRFERETMLDAECFYPQ